MTTADILEAMEASMATRKELLHGGERPEFVAKHPYAIYTGAGVFHSRYASLPAAARTLVYGSIHKVRDWSIIHDRTGQVTTFEDAWTLIRQRERIDHDQGGQGQGQGQGQGGRF